MFDNLLRIVCGDCWFRHTKQHQDVVAVVPDESEKKDSAIDKYKSEAEILKKRYGELEGLIIDIRLGKLLELIPKPRKRSDAYKGLVRYLRNEYNCELRITSRKSIKSE